jgi:Seed maturation protein
MPADKPAEQEDARRVVGAEVGSEPGDGIKTRPRPGGVAVSVATAARINRDCSSLD